MRTTRTLFVTVIAIAALFVLYLQTRGLDREKYSLGVSAIVALQGEQAAFDRELAQVRTRADEAKARVTDSSEQLRARTDELARVAAASDCAEFVMAVRNYQTSLDSALQPALGAVETAGFLTEGTRRIAADLMILDTRNGLLKTSRSAVTELQKQLMLFDLAKDGELGKALADAIARLKSAAQDEPVEAVRTELEALARHAQTYVDDRIILEERLAEVRAQDLERRITDILTVHENAFETQLRGSEYFRLGLFIFTVALLARLAQNMREIKRRTRELHEANQTLEQRVADRTRRLSATNTALQIEVVERERAELQVREALTEVEKASRTKSEFLANMSHEIRTPMTSILGFSERLLDARLTDTEKIEAVSTIRRNGDYLLQIINDILDISKIEAGMFSIEKIPCSPKEIVAEAHAAMEVRAAIKGIELVVESHGSVPKTIVSDPVRLKQILLNLIGNAIKFTQSGSVHVSVSLLDGDVPHLQFQVRDTGMGMDAETVARLFRPFMQADSSTTRRFGGTGLGLSISKHLAEQLGGQVSVESELGVGSTFTFTAETGPLDGVELESGPSLSFLSDLSDSEYLRPPPSLPGVRVLLAEDGEDNRRLLGYVLSSAQATTTTAVDGAEAIEKVRAAARAGEPFDVILMDMQMPVLDGYEAARRLRAQGCMTPIIALTAHAMAADRDKCIAAGCDDFCTKPIVRNTFLNVVAQWAERKKSGWNAPPLPPRTQTHGHGDATSTKTGASGAAHDPSRSSDAASRAAASPFRSAFASTPAPLPPVPKVTPKLTMRTPGSHAGDSSATGPVASNAPSGHALPPIDDIGRRIPPAPPAPKSPAPKSPAPAVGSGDSELVELVNQFVSELGGEVDEMRAALAADDLAKLGVLAHRLKGAAGSYGFPSLTVHASTLEKQAKSGGPRIELERDLERIAALCAAARAERGL